MDKAAVGAILHEIGLLLELRGENPFKVRAYYQAARVVEGLTEDLAELVRTGRLGELAGIGPALQEKIATLVTTGRLPYYENLRAQVPPGLLEFLRLPGLGPRKVQVLYRELGLTTLDELAAACRAHRLRDLPGFGAKTEEKILAGLEWLAKNRGLHLWATAAAAAAELKEALLALPEVLTVEVAGSIRRAEEVVRDIHLVAATENPLVVGEAFLRLPLLDMGRRETLERIAAVLKAGIPVELWLAHPEEFPGRLLYLTGNAGHLTALGARAAELGLKLDERGLCRGGERLFLASEEAIYAALGLEYVPPELREGGGEVEAAAAHELPPLVEISEIRGALHVHTSASDGVADLAEMARTAAALGWEYMGIADHSQSAAYAGGLKPDELIVQWEAIAAHNRAGGRPYLLAGIEAEISSDGSLDYPDEILARFDYVVASVHSHFHLDRAAMTARIVRALQNPYVTVLGHPEGRILLERAAYAVDMEEVLRAAAASEVAVEINASPYRLDLDWRWFRRAREMGLVFWINPDAHSPGELAQLPYGLNVARKGWLTPAQVANTWSLAELKDRWAKRRGREA
ncbi:MAG: DNA polymerase/3'-5' exonuclease PolX [Firmicutes bacterium]|nr:DNA polymerase/3'-5' exonuclease PolX [Bacillota bacterium]